MSRLETVVDGIKISYLDQGLGSPVLLLHGGGTEAVAYKDLIKQIASKHRVISPDIPFFGKSGSPGTVYDFDNFAKLFIKFIEIIDINQVVVIGYSFGGGIAARMGESDRIKKILLCSPAIITMNVDIKGLANIIKSELLQSFKDVSNLNEFLLLAKIDLNVIKNFVGCKNKKLLVETVIKCLNQEWIENHSDKLALAISDKDPIFKKEDYFKTIPSVEVLYTEGSHMWPIYKINEITKICHWIDAN